MFKFKSRLDIAKDVINSYDEEKLFARFNDYCEDFYDAVFYNDSEFLSMFSKDDIADYASYKYRPNDTYVRLTPYGFESTNRLRDLIDGYYIEDVGYSLLQNDDIELQNAYDDYLKSLAEDDSVSIQDWVENIVFYNDNDYDKKSCDIDSSAMIVKKFTEHFSTIYNRSNQKAVQYATKVIKERTDIFPDDFIEKNL